MLSTSFRSCLTCAALVALTLSTASCGKKSIVVPGDGVDGAPSSSQLIVHPDAPTRVFLFDDVGALGCSDDDTLVAFVDIFENGEGVVNGTIFDYTPASAFQVLRQEGSGFLPLRDFVVEPTRRYPDGQADVFKFTDRPPTASPSYIARGAVDGQLTAVSPKTNVGTITASIDRSLTYNGITNICGDTPGQGEFPPDSLIDMSWSAVPGAAGYWVQVYQFGGANFLSNVFPTPVFTGESVDYFLGFFPASVTSYHIGDPAPTGARIIKSRGMINGTEYAVRISAVDANGQLIATTGSSMAYVVVRLTNPETNYLMIPLSATVVHPGNPSLCEPGCPRSAGTALPSVRVFREASLPAALR